MEITTTKCIRATNSVDFVERVFACYRERQIFAISSHPDAVTFEDKTGLATSGFLVPEAEGGWLTSCQSFPDGDGPAQIVFTSGTEGTPKAIVLSYSNLCDVVKRINDAMEVTADIREYIGVPVYHSFGLGRCRAVAAAGGSAFLPRGGFNPVELQKMLTEGSINAVSAVPSLWRTVLDNEDLFSDVREQVRWIEIGSQYMAPEEKRRLHELFYRANIVQHYGLTEASRTTLLRVDQADDAALQSVGKPAAGTDLALTESGRLKVRGPHVAIGRLQNGYVQAITDEQGWFETSDLAEIHNGDLFYKGRADDVINMSGVKFDPANIEAEVNRNIPLHDHVLLCRIPDELRGDGVVSAWLTSSGRSEDAVRGAIAEALDSRGIHATSAIKTHRIEQVPKTATGKIKRKEISNAYLQSAAATQTRSPRNKHPETVEALYKSIFVQPSLSRDDTFASLGGGSLNYIMASVALERILGDLPANWEKLTVGELIAMEGSNTGKTKKFAAVETSLVLRAYAVTAVVINHAGLHFLAGGAALLMLAAGLNFCRFQWQSCLLLNFWPLARSVLVNVLIPYWGLLVVFPLLKGEAISYEYLFLFGNNVRETVDPPFPAWFVSALVQGLLVFLLPLAVARVRRWASANTLYYGAIMLAGGCVIRLADGLAGWGASRELNGMQFSWVFWLFAIGFCIQCVQSARTKTIATIAVAVAALAFYGGDWSRILTVGLGTAVLIWLPSLRVPRLLKPTLGMIGSASLFIYLLHSRAPVEFLPPIFGVDWFRIVVGVGIGVAGWYVYSTAIGFCSTRWSLMNDPKK